MRMLHLNPLRLTIETPIMELKGLGIPTLIFVKRDDLNGLLISGNKARKLEYLFADAKKKRCDTIVTCGPAQSNHCRTTAVFAGRFGFDCHLLLRVRKTKDRIFTGNLLLDKLMGAQIIFINPSQYDKRTEVMNEYAKKLRRNGKKPYLIPEGGSNEIGALGYIDCMKEIGHFIKKNSIEAVYCAVGSGGTYAGLLLGQKMARLNLDLNGIIVCDTVDYFATKIMEICSRAIEKFRLEVRVTHPDIKLIDGYVGEGYGIPYRAELETIKNIARLGIILEPVYTGKAFYGMLEHLKKKKYKRVMFIHTGGIFSIFAYHKELVYGH